MNFGQLLHKFLKHRSKALLRSSALINYFKIKNIAKQKLKLGLLAFDVKEVVIGGVKVYETIEIRYTRQDNTFENSIKIETRLAALKWKWDFYNVVSFLLLALFVFFFVYYQIYFWYQNNLSFLDNSSIKNSSILAYTFNTLLEASLILNQRPSSINSWLSEVLLNLYLI